MWRHGAAKQCLLTEQDVPVLDSLRDIQIDNKKAQVCRRMRERSGRKLKRA